MGDICHGRTLDGMSTISKGISATWWYTAGGVVMFQVLVVLIWLGAIAPTHDIGSIGLLAVGGALWCVSSVPLLQQYRHRDETAGVLTGWRSWVVPLIVSIAFGIVAGLVSGLWIAAALPPLLTLMYFNWPRGVRGRLVIFVTAVLIALWIIDLSSLVIASDTEAGRGWWLFGFFSIVLPAMTVLSLWWWDVVVMLDRARAAESRLGATQERLRVATDVHDLQGHHLQVIALQLELADRLLTKGQPEAALEQVQLARGSVDEARQGTRDLATRFRGVPLPDEIANAVDLLRAAGTVAESTIDADAHRAPASVLGPVIRESTTNVLKHGGGKFARLSLTRSGSGWQYAIVNDRNTDAAVDPAGSGIAGITRRVEEAGGAVTVQHGRTEFSLVATVPGAAS